MARRRVIRPLPALTQHRVLRFCTLAALYLGQGLPEGLLYVAVPAWLAQQGVPATEIGEYIAVILLPWSFKLVNGPIMDRWTFLPMGRRRPWVLAAQTGLIASLLALSTIPQPSAELAALTTLGVAVNFFGAFQDVAVDGMAIDILPENEQARANGIMWGSKTIGISAGAGVSGALMAGWGFDAAIGATAGLVGLIMLWPLLMRERPGERLLPWSQGQAAPDSRTLQLHSWRLIVQDLWGALVRRVSLLFILLTFLALVVYGLDTAALPVMAVQELGWTQPGYTQFAMWAGLAAGAFGMLVAGPVTDRFGPFRILAISLTLAAATHLVVGLLRAQWESSLLIEAYMLGYGVIYVLMSVALYATAMRLCDKHVAATQFAAYMAVVNLGTSAGASFLGPVRSQGGYETVFLVMAACSVAAFGVLVLSVAVARRKR